jgi:hypothetical protein
MSNMLSQKSSCEIQNISSIGKIDGISGLETKEKNNSYNKKENFSEQSEIDKVFANHLESIKNAFKFS